MIDYIHLVIDTGAGVVGIIIGVLIMMIGFVIGILPILLTLTSWLWAIAILPCAGVGFAIVIYGRALIEVTKKEFFR